MTIEFSCPNCGKRYTVRNDLAGRIVRCSGCNLEMTIPAPSPGLQPPPIPAIKPAPAPPPAPAPSPSAIPSHTKKCPFCAEIIKADARKCRYCGEFLSPDAPKTGRGTLGGLAWVGIIIVGVLGSVMLLTTGVKTGNATPAEVMLAVILVTLLAGAYFLPTIVAAHRGHPNTAPIAIINIVFGWTLIGYVVALAWSFSAIERK